MGNGSNRFTKRMSICADCAEVWCPWIQFGEPTPGWEAKPAVIRNKSLPGEESSTIPTWEVTKCPLFVYQPEERPEQQDIIYAEGMEGSEDTRAKFLYNVWDTKTNQAVAWHRTARECAEILGVRLSKFYRFLWGEEETALEIEKISAQQKKKKESEEVT